MHGVAIRAVVWGKKPQTGSSGRSIRVKLLRSSDQDLSFIRHRIARSILMHWLLTWECDLQVFRLLRRCLTVRFQIFNAVFLFEGSLKCTGGLWFRMFKKRCSNAWFNVVIPYALSPGVEKSTTKVGPACCSSLLIDLLLKPIHPFTPCPTHFWCSRLQSCSFPEMIGMLSTYLLKYKLWKLASLRKVWLAYFDVTGKAANRDAVTCVPDNESMHDFQVVLSKTLSKPGRVMSVATKIAIQINCKLGGEAWMVKIPVSLLCYCYTFSVKRSVSYIEQLVVKWSL